MAGMTGRHFSVLIIAAILSGYTDELPSFAMTKNTPNQQLMVSDHEGGLPKPARFLSGAPETLREEVVQKIIKKIESCWFQGRNAPLKNFYYERGAGELDLGRPRTVEEIILGEGEDSPRERFKFSVAISPVYARSALQKAGVEIWTINYKLLPALAGRLDREMRAWELDRANCEP